MGEALSPIDILLGVGSVFRRGIVKGLGSIFSRRGAKRVASQSVDDLLRPGGQLIGRAGSSSRTRIVEGSLDDAQSFFTQLSRGGKVVDNPSFPGTLVRTERGFVGLRPVSRSGPPTIDVNIPGIGIDEIKFILP